ncbi:hypothetical protein BH09ACT3_BH09ACT3_00170 [soil metagenome]
MRTRAALTGTFASLCLVVIGWQFGGATLGSSSTGLSTTASGTGSTTDSRSAPSTDSTSVATGSVTGTFSGSSQSTRFGNVQVKVVVASGTITDVLAVQLTDDGGRSVQISNRAAPILRAEVLRAQSANVSNVTGATYTSDAYLASVQSALDQAGL